MKQSHTWTCFGKLWDSGRVECTGGFDLAYVSPNKTNYRTPCKMYEQCRAQKEGRVIPQVIPANNLTGNRPQQPLQPPPPPPPQVPQVPYPANAPQYPAWQPQAQYAHTPPPQPYPQPYQHQYANQQAAYPPTHAVYVQPHVAQMGPTAVPAPYQAFGAQMPAYLAIPEPLDGTPWFGRLVAEMLRSTGKALGHSAASFIDHNPMRMHSMPVQPVAPTQQPQPVTTK